MENSFDYASLNVPTPCFLIDRALLRRNMRTLKIVQERTGAEILLALKAFATWGVFDEMKGSIAGATASSIYEARLAKECDMGQVHVYSPAYTAEEMTEAVKLADHVVFNSFKQWETFRSVIEGSGRNISPGLRINPEYSEVHAEIYNPCTIRSRFGVRQVLFDGKSMDGIEGLHFHTMCQQGPDVLERTLENVEKYFGKYFSGLKWINFGGGHHITREGYDVDWLCEIIDGFKQRTGLHVYLEPGEAHVMNTGFMVTKVLDILENPHSSDILIVDSSASAHMPDILEMPYTPELKGASIISDTSMDMPLDEFENKYIVGGKTCLSGDIIGEYGFDKDISVGDKLVFCDMSQYTLVKNTMFNGIQLPAIASCDSEKPGGDVKIIREFGYEDFKGRLS